jgi:predicted O-methyltransferase YrrM
MREPFDDGFLRVVGEYERRMDHEHELIRSLAPSDFGTRRDEFLLSVGEDTANLLRDLALGRNAKIIVELGTSYGYSTLFLADAARRTGGKVFSYDVIQEKQDYARERLRDAGLAAFVDLRLGDAVDLLADQPGPVDLVLLDLWKDQYVACFERLYPMLAPDGMIVADNMLYPENTRPHAEAYQRVVRAQPGIEAAMLPIGSGIDLAVRRSSTGAVR